MITHLMQESVDIMNPPSSRLGEDKTGEDKTSNLGLIKYYRW